MTISYTYWKDGDYYIGYLNQYPDYETEGFTLDELKENLIDIYKDIQSEEIPYVKKVGELVIA